jgi:metallophosphoesterase (TIGR00282 family)
MNVNILAVGDVVGAPGLSILAKKLRTIQKLKNISFTVVNGENAAMCGLTPRQAEDIFDAGADVITLGNHTWGRRDIASYLDDNRYILRPANYAPQCPGRGWNEFETAFGVVCVINLIGRCGMTFGPDNPFFEAGRILKKSVAKIKLLDFHAEATSEKLAMAYHIDGKVSALWGTHTHVQTSDAVVFPKGTGYITDLGMTGAVASVLGIRPEQSISMFLGNPPQRYTAPDGTAKIECAIFEIDPNTGHCVSVEALRITD